MNVFNVMITGRILPKKTQSSYSRSHVIRVEFHKYPLQQSKPEGLKSERKIRFKKQLKRVFRCSFQTLHYYNYITNNDQLINKQNNKDER